MVGQLLHFSTIFGVRFLFELHPSLVLPRKLFAARNKIAPREYDHSEHRFAPFLLLLCGEQTVECETDRLPIGRLGNHQVWKRNTLTSRQVGDGHMRFSLTFIIPVAMLSAVGR